MVEAVKQYSTRPIFFLDASESTYTGYSDEITTVRFSVANDVELVFHDILATGGVTKAEMEKAMRLMRRRLRLMPIREALPEHEGPASRSPLVRQFAAAVHAASPTACYKDPHRGDKSRRHEV